MLRMVMRTSTPLRDDNKKIPTTMAPLDNARIEVPVSNNTTHPNYHHEDDIRNGIDGVVVINNLKKAPSGDQDLQKCHTSSSSSSSWQDQESSPINRDEHQQQRIPQDQSSSYPNRAQAGPGKKEVRNNNDLSDTEDVEQSLASPLPRSAKLVDGQPGASNDPPPLISPQMQQQLSLVQKKKKNSNKSDKKKKKKKTETEPAVGSNIIIPIPAADKAPAPPAEVVSSSVPTTLLAESSKDTTTTTTTTTASSPRGPAKTILSRTNSDCSIDSGCSYDDILTTDDGPPLVEDEEGCGNSSSSSGGDVVVVESSVSLTGTFVGISGESVRETSKSIMRRQDHQVNPTTEGDSTTIHAAAGGPSITATLTGPPAPPNNNLMQLEEGRGGGGDSGSHHHELMDETTTTTSPTDFSGSVSDFQKLGILTIGEASIDDQEEEIIFLNNSTTSFGSSTPSSYDELTIQERRHSQQHRNQVLLGSGIEKIINSYQVSPQTPTRSSGLMMRSENNNDNIQQGIRRDLDEDDSHDEEHQQGPCRRQGREGSQDEEEIAIINHDEDQEANNNNTDLVLSEIDSDVSTDDEEEHGKDDDKEISMKQHQTAEIAINSTTKEVLEVVFPDIDSNDTEEQQGKNDEEIAIKHQDEQKAINITASQEFQNNVVPDLIATSDSPDDDGDDHNDNDNDNEAEDTFASARRLSLRRWQILPSSFNPPMSESDDDDDPSSSINVEDLEAPSGHLSDYESSEEWNLSSKFRRSPNHPRRFYTPGGSSDPPAVTVHPNSQALTTSSSHNSSSSGGFQGRMVGEDLESNQLFSSTTSSQRQIAPYRPRRFLSIRAAEFEDYVLEEEIKQEKRERRKTVCLTIIGLCVVGISGALFLYYVTDIGAVEE